MGLERVRWPLLPGLALALLLPAAASAQPSAALQRLLPQCLACHGADGVSRLDGVPSLAGQPRLYLENRLVMIREGLSPVPVMQALVAGLSDAELIALSRHFAALPMPPARPARDAARAARAEALAQRALCASCHGPRAEGREQMPRLAGQREDHLLRVLRAMAAGSAPGRDTLMTNALAGLSDADLADLAHHFATLP